MQHPLGRDISHIKVTAVLAVLVLIGAGIWQTVQAFSAKNSENTFVAGQVQQNGAQDTAVPAETGLLAASDTDPVTVVSANALGEVVGAYTGLQEQGQYSSTTGSTIADSIGMGLQTSVTYVPLDTSLIKTGSATSYQAMMNYRAALQTSLKPLLKNTQPEYELFGLYVQTKDQTYLTQLETAAQNYRVAASSTEQIVVPADAVSVQLGLVNSMNEFAAVVDSLVAHADDPIGSSVLLENYNNAENDVLTAFQNLVTYEQSKTQ